MNIHIIGGSLSFWGNLFLIIFFFWVVILMWNYLTKKSHLVAKKKFHLYPAHFPDKLPNFLGFACGDIVPLVWSSSNKWHLKSLFGAERASFWKSGFVGTYACALRRWPCSRFYTGINTVHAILIDRRWISTVKYSIMVKLEEIGGFSWNLNIIIIIIICII